MGQGCIVAAMTLYVKELMTYNSSVACLQMIEMYHLNQVVFYKLLIYDHFYRCKSGR